MGSLRSTLLGCFLTTLAFGPVAHAQGVDDLVADGIELRRQGQDRRALAAFQRAYELSAQPGVLAQVALAEQALGSYLEAESHLREALRARRDDFIRQYRPHLEQALEEIGRHLAWVSVVGAPDGARLFVAGEPAGRAPLRAPVRVLAGEVEVRVEADDRAAFVQNTEVRAGDNVRVHVEMSEGPGNEPLGPTSDHESAEGLGESDVFVVAGLTTLGVGLIGLGVGSGLLVIREDHARARLGCSDEEAACRQHYYSALDAERGAIAAFVVGGAFAVGGMVLLAISLATREEAEEQEELDMSDRCYPVLGGQTLGGACSFSF